MGAVTTMHTTMFPQGTAAALGLKHPQTMQRQQGLHRT
jgi:hypothetical protein